MNLTKSLVLAFAVAGMAVPAAAVTQVVTPDNFYKTATNLLGVPADSESPVMMIGDLDLVVTFSTALSTGQVGVDWATWGSPPDTENNTPRIFKTDGATTLTFDFSTGLTGWGFEAEPNPFSLITFTVDYYNGAVLLGSITRDIEGFEGARLLAVFSDTPITRATVTAGADFAIAQLRYQLPSDVVPEPATWAMLIAGFGLVGFAARRRRSFASLNA